MNLPIYIQQVKDRMEKSHKGPWAHGVAESSPRLSAIKEIELIGSHEMGILAHIYATDNYPGLGEANAEFIAHARADVEKLLKIVEIYHEALRYIGYSPTRDCKEIKARNVLDSVQEVLK